MPHRPAAGLLPVPPIGCMAASGRRWRCADVHSPARPRFMIHRPRTQIGDRTSVREQLPYDGHHLPRTRRNAGRSGHARRRGHLAAAPSTGALSGHADSSGCGEACAQHPAVVAPPLTIPSVGAAGSAPGTADRDALSAVPVSSVVAGLHAGLDRWLPALIGPGSSRDGSDRSRRGWCGCGRPGGSRSGRGCGVVPPGLRGRPGRDRPGPAPAGRGPAHPDRRADRAGVAAATGASDTTAWVAATTRTAGPTAARDTRLAATLTPGAPGHRGRARRRRPLPRSRRRDHGHRHPLAGHPHRHRAGRRRGGAGRRRRPGGPAPRLRAAARRALAALPVRTRWSTPTRTPSWQSEEELGRPGGPPDLARQPGWDHLRPVHHPPAGRDHPGRDPPPDDLPRRTPAPPAAATPPPVVVLVQGSGRTGTGWRSLTSSNTSPPTTSTPRPPPPSSSPSP